MFKRKAEAATAADASDPTTKKAKPSTNNSPQTDLQCRKMFYNIFAVGDRDGEDSVHVPHHVLYRRHRDVVADVKSDKGILAGLGTTFQSIDVVKIILGYADNTPVEWKYFGGALLGRLLSVTLLLDGISSCKRGKMPNGPTRWLTMFVPKYQPMEIVYSLVGRLCATYTTHTSSQTATSVVDFKTLCNRALNLTDELQAAQRRINRVLTHPTSVHLQHEDFQRVFLVSEDQEEPLVGSGAHTVSLLPYALTLNSADKTHDDSTDVFRFRDGLHPAPVEAAYTETESAEAIAAELHGELERHFRLEKSDSIWRKLILIARLFQDPCSIVF
jgi:hypothetical protein